MRLDRQFAYVDPSGLRWQVPANARVDGASIPPPLWPLIGGPFEGLYRYASVIHDYFCDVKVRTWQSTHRVFYDAMLTSGVGKRMADLMYWGVRRGGPKWSEVTVHNMNVSAVQVSAAADGALKLTESLERSVNLALVRAHNEYRTDDLLEEGVPVPDQLAQVVFWETIDNIRAADSRTGFPPDDPLVQAAVSLGGETATATVLGVGSGGVRIAVDQTTILTEEEVRSFAESLGDTGLPFEQLEALADAPAV